MKSDNREINQAATVGDDTAMLALIAMREKINAAQRRLDGLMSSALPDTAEGVVKIEVEVAATELEVHRLTEAYRAAVLEYVRNAEKGNG